MITTSDCQRETRLHSLLATGAMVKQLKDQGQLSKALAVDQELSDGFGGERPRELNCSSLAAAYAFKYY